MLMNFSYLIDKILAGSALPGSGGDLMGDLTHASEEGITAVVSLTETGLQEAMVREAGLKYLHLPIDDFQAPKIEQVEKFVNFVSDESKGGGAVLVHCFAGIGRTGTMLAAYLIREGASVEEAIKSVRRKRPGSVESAVQIDLLNRYSQHLNSGK